MSHLFQALRLGGLELPNRIVIAPMCQYSAKDGAMTDWHTIHLGSLALSGAGLLVVEATAVEPEGRITAGDVGLYDDATEAAFARVLGQVRAVSGMPVAVQLGHAGRKASCAVPWEGGAQVGPSEASGWQTVSCSALGHSEGDVAPVALDEAGLARVKAAFVQAAERSVRLGLQGIELHAAHGYLLHQFLSPLSNVRNDGYGGALEGRMRFPLEVFEAVRAAVPSEIPVWVRVSGTDWVPGGWDLASTVAFARALEGLGCAAVHVSSGGVSTKQAIELAPGYQVPLAAGVKAAVGMPVIAVGLITEPAQAEAVLSEGHADAVGLARTVLWDARWPWHAAAVLGGKVRTASQLLRAAPHGVRVFE